MDTIERVLPTRAVETQRTFSLVIYLLLVFGLSWPFQIAYALWGASSLTAGFWLSSASMVMVAVGTFLAGRYIFHDTFRSAGWRPGQAQALCGGIRAGTVDLPGAGFDRGAAGHTQPSSGPGNRANSG